MDKDGYVSAKISYDIENFPKQIESMECLFCNTI